MVKAALKKLAHLFGYDILHLPTDPLIRRRLDLLNKYKIDLIFDIGANTGQFSQTMRRLGYKGKLVSFEPLPDAFDLLNQNASRDPNWETVNLAIGNYDGDTIIHISQNSYSSSILEILPRHVESAPDSAYTGEMVVPVTTIDSIIHQYYHEGQQLFVKIDTQGYERHVLEGCSGSLPLIKGFQLELSLLPLYEGETLMQEMIDLLRKLGYKLMSIEAGHYDYLTGEILQVEGIFFR